MSRLFATPFPAARKVLPAAAGNLLGDVMAVPVTAFVASPASADDAKTIVAVGQPLGVATGPGGTLYVSDDSFAGGVNVTKPRESAPSRTITTGDGPSSLAVTPDGTLYVVNPEENSVSVVKPGTRG